MCAEKCAVIQCNISGSMWSSNVVLSNKTLYALTKRHRCAADVVAALAH